MLSKSSFAGAAALILAPLVVIPAVLVRPTLSDDAANQVAALTDHRQAMIIGNALTSIALVLLIAGIVWLALVLAPRAPSLAIAGGVLAVLGSLVVVFMSGVEAAAPAIVDRLDPARATATLERIQSSATVSGLGPTELLGNIGIALLGIAVIKAGAKRWAAAAIAIGALCEGAGFATHSKALVIGGFAILFVGLVQAVPSLVASPGQQTASKAGAGGVVAASGRVR
jgi:hypothetical protein